MCLAVPGRIVSIHGADLARSARVDFGGVTRQAALACVPEARVGDYVLVHAGIALAVVDEAAAARMLEDLAALGGGVP